MPDRGKAFESRRVFRVSGDDKPGESEIILRERLLGGENV